MYSTFRFLLHNSQTHGHTLSYYVSYSLPWPNITPASSIRFLRLFFFCGHNFRQISGPCMYSTCFTHQSRSAYSISSVTYDKCCLLTSTRWSSQLTAEHSWILLLYRQSLIFVTVTQLCFQCEDEFRYLATLRSSAIWRMLETRSCTFGVLLLSFSLPNAISHGSVGMLLFLSWKLWVRLAVKTK